MDHAQAHAFVDHWLAGWNAHDLDAVLGHFADDVVFSSPLAAQLLEDSDGVLHGRAALRAYWAEGLRRVPDLHFDVVAVYVGVSTVVINYRNQRGGLVCEVLSFDGPLVVAGHATYTGDAVAATGARDA